jgi:peptidoglycan/LPS O-acetylase OafA/YrhL
VLRHEFQPGRLVVGVFLTAAGVAYAGDAGGWWDTEWFAVIPVTVAGLFLAGVAAALTRAIRRRRGTPES